MRSTSAEIDSSYRELVEVGEILRPHGVQGEVKVRVDSDVEQRFSPGHELLGLVDGGRLGTLRVVSSRGVGSVRLLRFEGCEDRTTAEQLRGTILAVPRGEVPPAPAGSYYFYELLGCRCIDVEHGDLGEVMELLQDGGGIVLRVAAGSESVLIPFVEPYLEKVDVEEGRIELRLPAGLVEACAFRS